MAPGAIIAVVLLMIVPLPPLLLDLLLSVDIGLAVVLLFTAIYVKQPVEFSVFPSLLLLLTLIRLSLNVASTRLVLLHGHDGVDAAGNVIMAFGQFVVGGNFVVGIVVFLVLIAIQFLVINHGAVRISEVTARFTLDAMPGRQMAIDADLNAGVITDQEARARRDRAARARPTSTVRWTVRFASRSVMRSAAVLITAVNIVAGLIIGVAQHGLDLATAAETYTILTVGEGLVTAIPALLVSMAGGLITTRAASESTPRRRSRRAVARPLPPARRWRRRARRPGPHPGPSESVVSLRRARAWRCRLRQPPGDRGTRESARYAGTIVDRRVDAVTTVDPLGIEVGYALVTIADEARGGTLLSRVRAIRRQIATETGMLVPPVHVADNLQLGPRVYAILVKGVEVARGELYTDRLLAINPGMVSTALDGIAAREPAFGLPAVWLAQDRRDQAISAGYTVVDPTTARLNAPVGGHSHVPARSADAPADQGIDRPRRRHFAEARRGACAEDCDRGRRPARAAAVAPRARSRPRPDDDSRGDGRRGGRLEGPRCHRRIGPCRARPVRLPHLSGRERRTGVLSLSPALEDVLVASLTRTDRGAVLALDPARAQSLATRLAKCWPRKMWHNLCSCVPRCSVRTSGDCSPARCPTSPCSRTPRCPRR